MSSNTSTRSRHSYGVLAKMKISELKKINVSLDTDQVDIVREIDDPRAILPMVHLKQDCILQRGKSIFDRDNVLANYINVRVRPSHTSSLSNSQCFRRKLPSRSISLGRRKTDGGSVDRGSDSSKYKSKERRCVNEDRSFEKERCDRARSCDRWFSRQISFVRASSRRDRRLDKIYTADRLNSCEKSNRSLTTDRRIYIRHKSRDYWHRSINSDSLKERRNAVVRRRSSSRKSMERYRSRSRDRKHLSIKEYPTTLDSREGSGD